MVVAFTEKKRSSNNSKSWGLESGFFPPRCTGQLQPVYIGVTQPFKAVFCSQWDQWIHKTKFQDKVKRIDISKWVMFSLSKLTTKIVRNSWRHCEYNWFPDEAKATEQDVEFFWEEWILDEMGGGRGLQDGKL